METGDKHNMYIFTDARAMSISRWEPGIRWNPISLASPASSMSHSRDRPLVKILPIGALSKKKFALGNYEADDVSWLWHHVTGPQRQLSKPSEIKGCETQKALKG